MSNANSLYSSYNSWYCILVEVCGTKATKLDCDYTYIRKVGHLNLSTTNIHPRGSRSGTGNLIMTETVLFIAFFVWVIFIFGVMTVVSFGALAAKRLVEFIAKVTSNNYNNFTIPLVFWIGSL